jgi:hypothetical protein
MVSSALVEPPGAQKTGPADDGVERRAQLVRQGGEEFVLDAVGVQQLLVGAAHRLFDALAGRDVADDEHRAREHRLIVRHRVGGDAEPTPALLRLRDRARRQLGEVAHRQRLIAEDRRDQAGVGHADHLGERTLQKRAEGAIAALHVARAIEQADAVGDGVEGLLPLACELVRGLFGAARAQDGAHRRDELDRVDGQREIAVRARVESGADVVRPDVGRRHMHDGDRQRLRIDA